MKKQPAKSPKPSMTFDFEAVTLKIMLTAIFIVVAFSFFAFLYPYHLHYHEELQMFEWTGAYAASVISAPGGLAAYLSRFCVQLFYHTYLGAMVMALLLAAVQLTAWMVMPRKSLSAYVLSFVPAVAMWAFVCDENAMPSALIALIFTQLAASLSRTFTIRKAAGNHVRRYIVDAVVCIILLPLMYWYFGALALILPLMVALRLSWSKDKLKSNLITTALGIVVAVLCPLIVHSWVSYPLGDLTKGVGYMRFQAFSPTWAWVAAGATLLMQIITKILPQGNKKPKLQVRLAVALCIAVVIGGTFLIRGQMDMTKEEAFEYHYLAGQQKWQKIIEKAEKNPPTTQMPVIYTNLALAKTGQLNERMLQFFQNGTDGLLTPFGGNFFLPFATAEAYYQMGLIKPAQFYEFEIQESIPDAQRSARCTKRLAEIYLINGEYELARKYLKSLSNTLYYKEWADKQLKICGDDQAVSTHPEYGPKRQQAFVNDYFFGDFTIKELLIHAINDRPDNRLVFEYLVAWHLLGRDIEPLPEVMALGKEIKFAKVPTVLQQALALQWAHDHDTFEGMPTPLSPEVKSAFTDFTKVYRPGITSAALPQNMQRTYWGYFFEN